MKTLVGIFNQKKALLGAFPVIVKTDFETDGSSAAIVWGLHSVQLIIKVTGTVMTRARYKT